MGPLVLLKNYPMMADDGQSFITDWMPMDSQFQNGTIHVHCQTLSPPSPVTGLQVVVQTSFDTVEANQIGSTINVNTPGSQSSAITSNIASLVRVKVTNGEASPQFGILSVWLQPKSE